MYSNLKQNIDFNRVIFVIVYFAFLSTNKITVLHLFHGQKKKKNDMDIVGIDWYLIDAYLLSELIK